MQRKSIQTLSNRMLALNGINISYTIFIINEFANFFWNMFNSKSIEIGYIIINNIQSNPMSFY